MFWSVGLVAPMIRIMDETEFCAARLKSTRESLAILRKGLAKAHGVRATALQDATDGHIKVEELNERYWRARLRLLGVTVA